MKITAQQREPREEFPQSIDKVLHTLPMDLYYAKKHRSRGIFDKFGE